ncbi:hypothetical protein [Glutamicibacter sp. MCAF14]|uniref:hypothetical protein n=1 Tax=Glutamicibacter sp. MCAF14 TaxID=3233043 RepID=UPI003F907DA3
MSKKARPVISRAARVVSAIAMALVAVHLFLSVIYNFPDEKVQNSAVGDVASQYIRPYFVQGYRIFAALRS